MADITIAELTTGSVTGTGVFDLLMASVSEQLKAELVAQRITKADYAAVYTSALSAALNTSSNFVLNKQASAKQAELLEAQKLQADAQTILTTEQKLTQVQQTALGSQKVLTEKAQILNTVDGNTVEGLIGFQKTLYNQQTEGYKRDAEQKAVKILADRWNLSRSTDSAFSELGTGLENANIQNAMQVLFSGIGATFYSPP